jgi:hypothetical protein
MLRLQAAGSSSGASSLIDGHNSTIKILKQTESLFAENHETFFNTIDPKQTNAVVLFVGHALACMAWIRLITVGSVRKSYLIPQFRERCG